MSGGGTPGHHPAEQCLRQRGIRTVSTASMRRLIVSRSRSIQIIGLVAAWSLTTIGPSAEPVPARPE